MQPPRFPESPLVVRVVRDESELATAFSIRERVFIEEQACPPDEEWDSHDATSRHLVGYVDGEAVAVARWRAVPHAKRIVAKLERFAVLREFRGRGFGGVILRRTMDDALMAGFDEYLLHAQEHLESFYAQFGFQVCGRAFPEAGIQHVPMDLLRPDQSLSE